MNKFAELLGSIVGLAVTSLIKGFFFALGALAVYLIVFPVHP
jgi:hypothetical protein